MILADTSVWVDHFRKGSDLLADLLERQQILTHPFVIGELACGNLRNRSEILDLLSSLPSASAASDDEVLAFVESRNLMEKGIGWVDAHLLAATALTAGALLWTRDRRLGAVAEELDQRFDLGKV